LGRNRKITAVFAGIWQPGDADSPVLLCVVNDRQVLGDFAAGWDVHLQDSFQWFRLDRDYYAVAPNVSLLCIAECYDGVVFIDWVFADEAQWNFVLGADNFLFLFRLSRVFLIIKCYGILR
jgi:hypothetical protein